ncbi:hypothetical protein [Salmonirosea aquatica]|uniref:Uncharacterized protein n=1 Tax=Salmonirosea aquatica TaxID=2654236 RepID=A0A7C9BU93_9BACT|nr:hypothetical protein [Cytophagaceae bacterium SJW1-29]
MNRYITQLIEDLKALQRGPSEPWYNPEEGVELDFADVVRYLSSDHEQQLGEMLDLLPEQFPPVQQLTAHQMRAVVSAYTELLSSWGICLVIPEGVPAEIAYTTAVGTLQREVFVSQHGMVTLEFCNYIQEECPFGEWCHCDEYDDLPSDENEADDSPADRRNP